MRSDKLSQDIIAIIHAAAFQRCPTSPCSKDERRRRLARGVWETARAIYRFETWNEYWSWFRAVYPATASKIASKERPEEAPRAFRDNQPWNLMDKGGDSCLCQSCEGMQKMMLAASRAAGLLRSILAEHYPIDDDVGGAAAGAAGVCGGGVGVGGRVGAGAGAAWGVATVRPATKATSRSRGSGGSSEPLEPSVAEPIHCP